MTTSDSIKPVKLAFAAASILLLAIGAFGQEATGRCRPPAVVPTANEPPARLIVDPPLPRPLASRGVAIIEYCTENLQLVPVSGPDALAVTPRVGHLHVKVDDATWIWADASGNPIILMGLAPGPHRVLIELANANHQPLDMARIEFVAPATKPQTPGTKRTELQRHALSIPGREMIQVRVDFDPGYIAPRHTHFGEEIIYVLEGTLEYQIEGQPTVIVKPGDVLFVPAGKIHTVKNIGGGNGAELATYLVEKGKPLVTLVP